MHDKTYYNKIGPFCRKYNVNNLTDEKTEFRYFCFKYTEHSRNWKLPEIKTNEKNESVLIEFRQFPHVEFLIRNTIRKLGEDWSHTVVCGSENYDLMKEICNSISEHIRLIKIDKTNLNIDEYSLLLGSKEFWEQLRGEKILIYQEDSCMFKTNINDFMIWDYIGAPWPYEKNDTPNAVGNGGFSLRTKKCMIDVINCLPITNVKLNSSTLNYMCMNGINVAVEDVYFSKTMQEYCIGHVADWISAYDFSMESIMNENSLGGHNFFIFDKKWKERMYKYVVNLDE
jgi:hypothetical protein